MLESNTSILLVFFAVNAAVSAADSKKLHDQILALETASFNEPLVLGIDSRLKLADLIADRAPKDALRVSRLAIDALQSVQSEATHYSLALQAVSILAKIDVSAAVEFANTMPLSIRSNSEFFPRDMAYRAILARATKDRPRILLEATQFGACPIASIVQELPALQKSDAQLLVYRTAQCITSHRVTLRFATDVLQYLRENILPEQSVGPILEYILSESAKKEFAEGSPETITGNIRTASGGSLKIDSAGELLGLQVLGLARERYPSLYKVLASKAINSSLVNTLQGFPGIAMPQSTTYALKNVPKPTLNGDELNKLLVEFQQMSENQRPAFARSQNNPEFRVALLMELLQSGRVSTAEEQRLIAEIGPELSSTRSGWTRVHRSQALLTRAIGSHNAALIRTSVSALVKSLKDYCRCEQDGCKSLDHKEDCLPIYTSASKIIYLNETARATGLRDDPSLRTRFMLFDLQEQLPSLL